MATGQLLQTYPAVFISLVALLGLLVGSFLNVVIHRLPIMLRREWCEQCHELLADEAKRTASDAELNAQQNKVEQETATFSKSSADDSSNKVKFNLVVPRSRCPHCGHMITALENIPIISYLFLRGRCSECSAPISMRYPIIEFITALLSALVAWKFGFHWATAAALFFTWSLIALTCIDLDEMLLPDVIVLPLLWAGLLVSWLSGYWNVGSQIIQWATPAHAILGAVAGYLFLWGVFHAFRLITGKEGMGYGDFKLFAAFGAWMGWQSLTLIIILSSLVGALVGIALILTRNREWSSKIPFGPYLAGAGWIALLWGQDLISLYWNFTPASL